MPFPVPVPDDATVGFIPEAQQQFLQEQMDLVDPTQWFLPNAAFPIHEDAEPVFTEDMLSLAERESTTPPLFGGFQSLGDADIGDTFDAFGDDLFSPVDDSGGFPSDGFEGDVSPPPGYPVEAARPLPQWSVPTSPPTAVIMGNDGRLIDVFAPLSPGAPAQPTPAYISPYDRVPVTSSFPIKDCGCGCGQCGSSG